MTLHPRAAEALRWSAFVAGCWALLWPVLTITISGDDLINPFFVVDDYGANPIVMIGDVSRDLTRAGHFNHVGQNVSAWVFVVWAYLLSWGVRFSLIYATTKIAVYVVTVIAAARLFRTLATEVDRRVGVWPSRLAVALVLLPTLQIHVGWSSDPVASFPLSGYLSAAIGLWAMDVSIRALRDGERRRLLLAAGACCLSILWYEINVAVVVALVPIALLHARQRGGVRTAWRPVGARLAWVVVPPALMTLVLQAIAARANRGYTGTTVEVGDGTLRVFARAFLGSLPAAAWNLSRDYVGEDLEATLVALAAVVVAAVGFAVLLRHRWRAGRDRPRRVERTDAALLLAVPLVVWFVATALQATTQRVRAETPEIGYVYNFYAYGSIAVALIALLGVSIWRRWTDRRILGPMAVIAVAFVGVQASVNEEVREAFDTRLAVSDALVNAYADDAPEEERCAALAAWQAGVAFLPELYRTEMTDGIQATHERFRGEPFCAAGP